MGGHNIRAMMDEISFCTINNLQWRVLSARRWKISAFDPTNLSSSYRIMTLESFAYTRLRSFVEISDHLFLQSAVALLVWLFSSLVANSVPLAELVRFYRLQLTVFVFLLETTNTSKLRRVAYNPKKQCVCWKLWLLRAVRESTFHWRTMTRQTSV